MMTPREVCEALGVTNTKLQDWRTAKEGPAYVRLGHRTVRYRKSVVDAYLADLEREDG
jgi:excisionase family DNA binding protein